MKPLRVALVSPIPAEIEQVLALLTRGLSFAGHDLSHRFRIYTAGQKRRMTPAIKQEMRRRAAIEPVIGHLKNEHRMRRNYLAHAQGDAINAILAAAAYNFRLLLNWLRLLLCLCWAIVFNQPRPARGLKLRLFTADYGASSWVVIAPHEP
jgi:IS5 family transposase